MDISAPGFARNPGHARHSLPDDLFGPAAPTPAFRKPASWGCRHRRMPDQRPPSQPGVPRAHRNCAVVKRKPERPRDLAWGFKRSFPCSPPCVRGPFAMTGQKHLCGLVRTMRALLPVSHGPEWWETAQQTLPASGSASWRSARTVGTRRARPRPPSLAGETIWPPKRGSWRSFLLHLASKAPQSTFGGFLQLQAQLFVAYFFFSCLSPPRGRI